MGGGNRRRVGQVGLALLVAAGLLVVGVLAGLAYRWEDPPSLLAQPTTVGDASVTQRTFDDAKTVSMSVTVSSQQNALSPAAGRVSASACVAGQPLASGGMVVAVDGTPLIGLATSLPLWRDLERGDQGPDVTALTAELIRLQRLEGQATDTMTGPVVEAFNQLALNVGVAQSNLSSWTVARSGIVWLPEDSLVVESCPATVGSAVAPEQVVATFASTLTEARITTELATTLAGDRVLLLDGRVEVAVPAEGLVTDPAQLAVIASSDQFRYARREDAGATTVTVMGRLKLVAPIDVWVVAPAALVATGSDTGCVIGDGRTLPVRVIASELGQTFVTFDDQPPSSVRLNPPRDTLC
jgi:hypothetical protein